MSKKQRKVNHPPFSTFTFIKTKPKSTLLNPYARNAVLKLFTFSLIISTSKSKTLIANLKLFVRELITHTKKHKQMRGQ